MDYTPIHSGYRGNEIDLWLASWQGEAIESFVILDDDDDMEPFMDNLVQTSFADGLQQKHIDTAVEILNRI